MFIKRIFRARKYLLPLVAILMLLCLLAACTAGTGGGETTVDDILSDTTAADTSVEETTAADVTETDTTPEETTWAPDMGTFNEGKVIYEKTVETEIVATFPEAQLGKPMKPGSAGVTAVFNTDFTDKDATVDGTASPRDSGAVQVVDGKLYMPYSSESDDHLAGDGWTTWFPNNAPSLSDSLQTSFAVKWDVRSKDTGAWMSAMIGCYVRDPAGKIPDNPGDGLWISFQEEADKITVYHPDTQSWHVGWADIPVEADLLDGVFYAQIVCMPDRTTYVYVCPEGGSTDRLVATVRFEDGKIRAYDEGNNMIKESDCTTNALKGDNYSVFVHGGGAAIMDEVAVMAASKGQVIEHATITATPTEGHALGLDVTDKTDLVSICYSVWFDAILGGGTDKVEKWNNVTESLAGNQPWGGVHAFHYWAKPAVGYYYRSSDKDVIRTHMTQLYAAGVDFIVIDLTNAGDGYLGTANWTSYIQTPMDAICDTIMEMRAEGKGTPYVVFWVGDGNGPLYKELYDRYHNVEKWKDCFVYWDNKPFMLTTHKQPAEFPYPDLFTTRSMWGLKGKGGYADGQWSFLNIDNDGIVAYDKDGKPEQMSVAVASQETYMSMPTAHGRRGGTFWFQQWYNAFKVHPKFITLTWWNEWTAQRFDVQGGIHFTDNYNQEYSRDIEPMEGGHGDQYYRWLIQYISAYKGGEECPLLVEEKYEKWIDTWLISHS